MAVTNDVPTNGVPTRGDDAADSVVLRELREARHLSQRAVGAAVGARQSTISRFEHRADMRISTLRTYVEALGGVLEIRVRLHTGDVWVLRIGEGPEDLTSPEK